MAQRITVERRGVRQRLDRYLAELGQWGSRARVQRLIHDGCVRVDGRQAKPDTVLHLGQIVEVEPPPPEDPSAVEPEAIGLDVLYEDEWILVINKPPGLVVHPAPGHRRGTLVAALLYHWRGTRPGLDPLRPGIVHRLDKDTSGVLVIAKDPDSLEILAKQFRNRQVEKQYVAAVHGSMRRQQGSIDQPIGRNPLHRKRMAVRPQGRPAATRFEVIGGGEGVTWVRLYPKTGRTHQLRVHLASIGHPIVADALYGGGRRSNIASAPVRQALHAERIAFRHPKTGEPASFTAPLAADLQAFWRHTMNEQRGSSLDNKNSFH